MRKPFLTTPKLRAIGWAVCVTVLLVGCAAGPDYVHPFINAPQTLTRSTLETTLASSNSSDISAQWWQAFGSPELNAML